MINRPLNPQAVILPGERSGFFLKRATKRDVIKRPLGEVGSKLSADLHNALKYIHEIREVNSSLIPWFAVKSAIFAALPPVKLINLVVHDANGNARSKCKYFAF
ncbi:hypothetical protein [Novipirellula rosea]|uniref:hypothetical protein n=1 Tax=Novipirellula rosea TaxID=1031540 RepID=UPI0030ED78BD